MSLSPNGFGTVVDIDTKGTFNVCRAAFEALKESKGQILNISATLHYLATPMQIHVSAAKGRRRCDHAKPLGRMGPPRHPRQRHRPRADRGHRRHETPACRSLKEKITRKIPLGRFGKIADIENAALFLVLRRRSLHQRRHARRRWRTMAARH